MIASLRMYSQLMTTSTNHGNNNIYFYFTKTINFFFFFSHFINNRAKIVLINTNNSQYKPDWFAYVKPWIKNFKLATCEIKPPSKVGCGDISDFIKLGIQMRDILDEILSIGVDNASVFGILIEGNFFFNKKK